MQEGCDSRKQGDHVAPSSSDGNGGAGRKPGVTNDGLLASCVRERQRKLPCQLDDLAPIPTWCRVWAAQCEQPLGLRELPEVKLWATKPGFQAARIGYFRDLLILRELNGVQCERRGLVLDFECAFVHPHGDLFPGEPIFAKEAPSRKRT